MSYSPFPQRPRLLPAQQLRSRAGSTTAAVSPAALSVPPPLAGRVAEGGHEGDPGGRGQRDHAQPARVGQPREAADAQATYHRRPARRRGRLHVPAQHGPHEESGEGGEIDSEGGARAVIYLESASVMMTTVSRTLRVKRTAALLLLPRHHPRRRRPPFFRSRE